MTTEAIITAQYRMQVILIRLLNGRRIPIMQVIEQCYWASLAIAIELACGQPNNQVEI